jgi:hypothetical protein
MTNWRQSGGRGAALEDVVVDFRDGTDLHEDPETKENKQVSKPKER